MNKGQIRKDIKKNAKLSLKGNTGRAILVYIIVFIIAIGISFMEMAVHVSTGDNFFRFNNISSFQKEHTEDIIFALSDAYDNFVEEYEITGKLNFKHFDIRIFTIDKNSGEPSPLYDTIAFVFSVILFLIMVPLTFGCTAWFVDLSEGRLSPLGRLFTFFQSAKDYFKAIWLQILLILRSFLWGTLISLVPLFLAVVAAGICLINQVELYILLYIVFTGMTLTFILSFFMGIFLLRYSAAGYCLIKNNYNSPKECIKLSTKLMKGHLWEYFIFNLSFLGWIILSTLTCGILFLWVVPYMSTATATFFGRLMSEYERKNRQPSDNNNDLDIPNFDGFLPEQI